MKAIVDLRSTPSVVVLVVVVVVVVVIIIIIIIIIILNSVQVYLYSAFHHTNRCKAALQENKFLQYV